MQPQMKTIQLIADYIKEKCGINVTMTALPENGGVTVEMVAGRTNAVSLDRKHQQHTLSLLFMCKNNNQFTAMETVANIGNMLSSATTLPADEDVQLLATVTKSNINKVAYIGDYWIYSLIVDVKVNLIFNMED